jgi:hypothetical protein
LHVPVWEFELRSLSSNGEDVAPGLDPALMVRLESYEVGSSERVSEFSSHPARPVTPAFGVLKDSER